MHSPKYSDLPTGRVRFFDIGKREGIVVCSPPGEPGAAAWLPAFDSLAHGFRIFAPDASGDTREQQAEAIKAFLDGNRIDAGHLLGYAEGAPVAALVAQKYPDRALTLTMVNAVRPAGHEPSPEGFQPVSCPTLLYWSADDPASPVSGALRLFELLAAKGADVRLSLTPSGGAAHFQAHPEEFGQHVLSFIRTFNT